MHVVEASGTAELELAARVRAGDRTAFADLVRRYQGPIFRVCSRYLDGPDAQDAAQETFVRAFVKRDRLDPTRSALPWLLVIAKNLCLDRLRKKRPEPEEDAERYPDLSSARDPAQQAESNQEMAALAHGLACLPDGQREAILRFHLESMSYQEIAESLEVPVGTVMTWIHRGRSRLRELVHGAASPQRAARGGPS
jgi:RNA polymerase sigma-70 factor (ECF subfamily)